MATLADGTAEREAAILMLHTRWRRAPRRRTVGADKAYDTHATGVVDVRERAFHQLPASTHQATPASAPHPATIAVHRRLGFRCLRPIAQSPVRLRHVGADAHRVEVDHGLIAVIPLVGDALLATLAPGDYYLQFSVPGPSGPVDQRVGFRITG